MYRGGANTVSKDVLRRRNCYIPGGRKRYRKVDVGPKAPLKQFNAKNTGGTAKGGKHTGNAYLNRENRAKGLLHSRNVPGCGGLTEYLSIPRNPIATALAPPQRDGMKESGGILIAVGSTSATARLPSSRVGRRVRSVLRQLSWQVQKAV